MSCIISAPSTDSGKTTLSLLISCWAYSRGLKLQTFKVGPDYLDQQQLSSIGQPICRNLDVFLSGEDWVKTTFLKYSNKYNLSLVEGAMGLFDGLGSTHYSSTANVAKILDLPIIFVVNARGQSASLLPLIKGFIDFDNEISIKGIIFNNVNSERHKKLIKEVFENQNIDILGFLPTNNKISLSKSDLGIVSPKDSKKKIDIDYFADVAEKTLDFKKLEKFLLPTNYSKNIENLFHSDLQIKSCKPVAIAEDKIFHFQYPETKEFLEEIGIPLVSWNLFEDEEIPNDVKTLIIPGGFPEKYAQHISSSKRSLESLRQFYKKGYIYAECGGMMILGESIKDEFGEVYRMANILPFNSKRGKLSVGYRYIEGIKDSQIIKKDQIFKGHEFHYWQIEEKVINSSFNKHYSTCKFTSPWMIRSWGTNNKNEGWSSENLHASWVHLHLPSNINAARNFVSTIEKFSK
ncbi:MAG: cobyrinic acid a,c-diamide synthase [Prochlorococcus sp. SP3034]|nr:cobyrinic acid a,c-diamide synthase [Prochlorococcus sp. SP3034]|tara:strand:+ start:5009 stop:6394 length:1386 start_codon:yes stop_codon:yes gene_type:complete